MNLKIVNNSGFELPKYETEQSAGLDVKAVITEEPGHYIINPGERVLIKTGLFFQLPEGYEAQVRPRSGLALKQGITVLNSPGTIDADYRGEIGVILINHGRERVAINHGDRIAQIIFNKIERASLISVSELFETERGSGGFGSTGHN